MKKAIFGFSAFALLAIPAIALSPVNSGLEVGEMLTPFHPTHVSGPDAGTDTCPPCKYGARPAVQIWANMDDAANLKALAANVSKKVASSKNELKGFVVNLTHCDKCVDGTKAMAKEAKLTNIGITYLKSDTEYVKNYKVNVAPEVKNTVFVYKDKKVVAKFVNLKADEAGLKQLNAAISKVDN